MLLIVERHHKENSVQKMIIPSLRYAQPKAAITWLCEAFGFEKHKVYEGDNGEVVHAELKYGNSLLMLGPDVPTEFGKYVRLPNQVGGFETQINFVLVEDVQKHFETAKGCGAEILMPVRKQVYGASDYVCRDPQGHIWSFGDYNPWQES